MNETLQKVAADLQARFGLEWEEYQGELTLRVPAERIIAVLQALKGEQKFEMLVGLTGVDYWPQMEPRFNVVYILYSFTHNTLLNVRVPVSGQNPQVPTSTGIYPNANWFEREVWDMFGIRFEGHPDPRRIIMPADWEGHPLRKDYPLGYEEVQFTFNFDEVNQRKKYASE